MLYTPLTAVQLRSQISHRLGKGSIEHGGDEREPLYHFGCRSKAHKSKIFATFNVTHFLSLYLILHLFILDALYNQSRDGCKAHTIYVLYCIRGIRLVYKIWEGLYE